MENSGKSDVTDQTSGAFLKEESDPQEMQSEDAIPANKEDVQEDLQS